MPKPNEAPALIEELGAHRCETLLNVHRTTILRWRNGERRCPGWAVEVMRAAARCHLPGQDSKLWHGWGFGKDGLLYSDTGYPFGPHDLLALPYERAAGKAQREEIADLRAQLEQLKVKLAAYEYASNDAHVGGFKPVKEVPQPERPRRYG